jgi:hypothetical protein
MKNILVVRCGVKLKSYEKKYNQVSCKENFVIANRKSVGDTVVSLSTGFSSFVLADLPQLREKKSASCLTLPNTTSFVRVVRVTLEQ